MSPFVERLASRLSARDTTPPDDGRKRAAVAAILYGERVLLMQRVEREGDPWSGHISLPGGGFHATDGDLLATAIRETREELGVDLRSGARELGVLPTLQPLTAGPNGVEVTPFVFVVADEPAVVLSAEAAGAFWLPLPLALSGALDGTYTYPNSERTFPCWTFEGHTIWGLTWRILGDLGAAAK